MFGVIIGIARIVLAIVGGASLVSIFSKKFKSRPSKVKKTMDNLDKDMAAHHFAEAIEKIISKVATEKNFNKEDLMKACENDIALAREHHIRLTELNKETHAAMESLIVCYGKIQDKAEKMSKIQDKKSFVANSLDKMKFWNWSMPFRKKEEPQPATA